MFELRDYQIECLHAIQEHFISNSTQLVQMPTGSGKTVVFWHYLFKNKCKSIIVCPTKDLVQQTYEKGRLISTTLSDIKTTLFPKTSRVIQKADHYIVTAASLWRDTTLNFFLEEDIDTIILDECHHSCSRTYQHFIHKLLAKNPKLKVIGFTATPERLDKGDLLTTFGKITFQRNVLDLIEKGHLCDVCAYKVKTGQKFSDKVISGGDFSHVALKDLDNNSRNKLIIKTYQENCKGKKTLIFCINVEHSDRLAAAMKKKGVKVSSIHSGLSSWERKYIIESFRNGEIDVLTNCQLLTEGFDEPSIEALIIARPTKSKALYCQMVGRGLRNHPGKDVCHLYELADNSHKICTFDVMAFEKKPAVEYPYGVKLSEIKREIEKLSLEIAEIRKEKINLFHNKNDKFSKLIYVHQALEYSKKYPSLGTYDVGKIKSLFNEMCNFELVKMKKENLELFKQSFLKNLSKDSKNKPRSKGGKIMLFSYLYNVAKTFETLISDGLDVYNVFMFLCLHECRDYVESNCACEFDSDLYIKYDGKIPNELLVTYFDIFDASQILQASCNKIEKCLRTLGKSYDFQMVYKSSLVEVIQYWNPTYSLKECRKIFHELIEKNIIEQKQVGND